MHSHLGRRLSIAFDKNLNPGTGSWMILIFLFMSCGCNRQQGMVPGTEGPTMFQLLKPDQTHVDFVNSLTEGLNTNVLVYWNFYNGGGVATGDLNGDGLQDIYLSGNIAENKLYLNKGGMQFEDVTNISGAGGRPGPWKTGVTLVDINGDGRLDIFVCHSGHLNPGQRINELLINQGNDQNSVPLFKESAAAYGLDFPTYTTQAYFFDYDLDGDLDLLLVNHKLKPVGIVDEVTIRSLMAMPDNESGIRLLQNDKGYFRDVTNKTGITNTTLSYGLAAGISDFNGDGLPDIYLSNDLIVPDRLYINNGNGTFSDQLQKQLGHISMFSMGDDIADINNDLKPDIYTLDMLPEDNRRQKLLFGTDNYETFNLNLQVGFYNQYMRNMLQLNNGNNTFSEIGQLSGTSNTDWSWAPLLADYDNDGWKDLFVSNGYARDYNNLDFMKFAGDFLRNRKVMRQDLLDLVKKMPPSDVNNYFFRNKGDLTFQNMSAEWGINEPSNSGASAYADLDNDGTLDLVVNNINKPAFIYKNMAAGINKNHYLSINLKGGDQNTQGLGAKVFIYAAGKKQYLEQMLTRGFQSSVSPVLHFGLGQNKEIDSLKIIWPRGKMQLLEKIAADRTITLYEKDAKSVKGEETNIKPIFTEVKPPLEHHIQPNPVNDFKRQPLLINPLSFSGPCMVRGDVNHDGLDDIFIGGGNGVPGSLYIQKKDGSFVPVKQPSFESDRKSTDAAAVFLDVNQDGNLDLYVCSGGYDDYLPGDPLLQDRLYINDGKGNFTKSSNALPVMRSSKGCVSVADINGDGYPDLFVGGRVVPGRYPETPASFILINDRKGNFTDQTNQINPLIKNCGMVSDAVLTDINGDKRPDLVIVGEWMPITVFENRNGKFIDATLKYFNKKYTGWWNCVKVADVNHDGHPDIIAGNLGLNTQCKASNNEPAEIYYKDFDDNGSVDPMFCFYIQHKSYPYVTRDDLLDQISMMRARFPDYKSYADATITDIFTKEELKGAGHLSVNTLSTTSFISNPAGKLHQVILPLEAQFSPVFNIEALDFDKDGKEDLLLCGNMNHARIHYGKYDASYGTLLKGDGNGGFSLVPQQRSGFKLTGDVRSIIEINHTLLFGINGVGVKAYAEK